MNPNTEVFLNCLDRAQAETRPFRHWLLEDALSEDACDGILNLPVEPPVITDYNGTREANNDTRYYFNPEACARFDVCRDVVDTLTDRRCIRKIEETCGIDLSKGHLRIEYTQDTDGFWLEPHTDISVKLYTMLIYLSKEPDLADAGTDIFDQQLNHVKTAPFRPNHGLIFIPGKDTWHGFIKRPIRGVRRSIIVNYVTDEWRERWQLA
ncbi:MAG: 2OG-Fe(II) oxygenase [Kiloniellaceae bacterium]